MTQPAQAFAQRQKTITITVNKKPVPVEGPNTTGLAIKQAAIKSGQHLGLDFQLSEIRGRKSTNIGDHDPVTVKNTSVFKCVAGDDNS